MTDNSLITATCGMYSVNWTYILCNIDVSMCRRYKIATKHTPNAHHDEVWVVHKELKVCSLLHWGDDV